MPHLFVNHLKEHLVGPSAVGATLRERAWKSFIQNSLPERKGAFQYVPLHLLYAQSYLIEKQAQQIQCVSSHPVVHMPLSDALKSSYSGYLIQRIERQFKEEKNPLAMLSLALCSVGLFIYVPPKACLDKVIEVIYPSLIGGQIAPRLYIYVGKGAQAALSIKQGSAAWMNSFVDIVLEEGASFTMLNSSGKELSVWDTSSLCASLKRSAQLTVFSLAEAQGALRQEMIVSLAEENAQASLKGLWTLEGKQETHTHVIMRHLAPNCSSMQHFKGILKEESASSFEGKIYVEPVAQKTEAYQLNNNLLLSKEAKAYSKPNLEIFADDVKASHGATIASVKDEDLFYLKTRGLSASIAKELLVQGFAQEILNQIPTYFYAKHE